MKLKHFLLALPLLLTACGNSDQIKTLEAQRDSLQAQNNYLNEFIGTVSDCIDSISFDNDSLFVFSPGESPAVQKQQILGKIQNLAITINNQKDRLAQLEEQMAHSKDANAARLSKIIAGLRKQIEEKEAQIASLQEAISAKDANIAQLHEQVAQLDLKTAQQEQALQAQEEALVAQDEMLNEGYVRIATAKELQEAGLLTKGSLFKKKKLDVSAIQNANFQRIDIRNATEFNIPGKKPKVLSPMPEGSYELVANGSGYTLRITNPAAFWSVSNYLIVQYNK